MWNTYPRHGILEFRGFPEPPKEEEFKTTRPYMKKHLPQTYVRKWGRNKTIFDQV